MNDSDIFDDIRVHFASRPYFAEMQHELQVLSRRVENSFMMEPRLPAPVVRPAILKALWLSNNNNNNNNNNKSNNGEFSVGYHYRDTEEHEVPVFVSGEFTTPRTMTYDDPHASQTMNYCTDKNHNNNGDGGMKSYNLEAGGVQTPHHIMRDNCLDTLSFSNVQNENNNIDFSGKLIIPEEEHQLKKDVFEPLKELDEASILQHVRQALRIYTHREELSESDVSNKNDNVIDNNNNNNNRVLEREGEMPETTSLLSSHVVSLSDPERALHWTPEVSAQALAGATRSVLAELDELERNHHDAVAAMLMKTPLRLQQEKEQTTDTNNIMMNDDDISYSSKKANQMKYDGRLDGIRKFTRKVVSMEPDTSGNTSSITAVHNDNTFPFGRNRISILRKESNQLLHDTMKDIEIDREKYIPKNLRQWDAENAPRFERDSISILRPLQMKNLETYDARSKWSNVSFL